MKLYFLSRDSFLLLTIQTHQRMKHQMHIFLALRHKQHLPLRKAKKALQSNMRSLGLKFCNRRIPGDGNCLFHALSDQLKQHQMLRIRHLQLRKRIVDYMSEHPYIVSNAVHCFAFVHALHYIMDYKLLYTICITLYIRYTKLYYAYKHYTLCIILYFTNIIMIVLHSLFLLYLLQCFAMHSV